jgi:hypothetical protein
VDITKDKPITILVSADKINTMKRELKNDDLYIEIESADTGAMVQHANTWASVHNELKTTIGAVVKHSNGEYYGITAAHGAIHPDKRDKAHQVSNGGDSATLRGLYHPCKGLDIAIVKLSLESRNMLNYTWQSKNDLSRNMRLFKAAGITGITSNEYVDSGRICETDNGIVYQSLMIIGNDDQTRPGDCGALHSRELDNHQFLPVGLHIGSVDRSKYQGATLFDYNFRALCNHFGMDPVDFIFHNAINAKPK